MTNICCVFFNRSRKQRGRDEDALSSRPPSSGESIYNANPADSSIFRDLSSRNSTSIEAQPRIPGRRILEDAQSRTTVGLPAGIELRSMNSRITAVAPLNSKGQDGSSSTFGALNQLRDGGGGSGAAGDHAHSPTLHHHHHEHHHRHDHHYSPQSQQDQSHAEQSPMKLIPRKQVPKQSQNDKIQAGPSQVTSTVQPQQQQPASPFNDDDNKGDSLPTPADYAALSKQHNDSSDGDGHEEIQIGDNRSGADDNQAAFHYRQPHHASQVAQLIYPDDNDDSHSETEAEIQREFNPPFRSAPIPNHHAAAGAAGAAAGKRPAQNSLGYAKPRNDGPPSTPPKGPAYLADLAAAAEDSGSTKTVRLVQPSLQHRPLPSIPSALAAGEDVGAHPSSRTAAAAVAEGEPPAPSSVFEREASPPGAYPLTPAVHTWNDENTRRIPVQPHDPENETGAEVTDLPATPATGKSSPFKKASDVPATPCPAQDADNYSRVSDEDSYRFTGTPSWVSTIFPDRSPLGSPDGSRIISPKNSPGVTQNQAAEGHSDTAINGDFPSTSVPLSTTSTRYNAYHSIDPSDHESIRSRLSEERDRILDRLAAHNSTPSLSVASPNASLHGSGDNAATTNNDPTTSHVGLIHNRHPSQASTFSAFSFSNTPPSMTRQDRGNQTTAAPVSPLAGRSRPVATANQTNHATSTSDNLGDEAGGGSSGVVSSIFGSFLGRSGTKHQRNELSKDVDS